MIRSCYRSLPAAEEVQVCPAEGGQHPHQLGLCPVGQPPAGQAAQAQGPAVRSGSGHGDAAHHGNQAQRHFLLQGPGCQEACGVLMID